jgi:sugar transferase (PEP-CTERM system associated)
VSRSSLAVSTHDGAEFGEQRVVTLRVFKGHIHRLGVLAFTEAAIAGLAVYAAIFIRFSGFSSTLRAFEASMGPIWPKAALIAAVLVLSMAALGLYQLRQRARFTGVFVRLLIALMVAQLALALVFYVAPSFAVGRGVLALTVGFAFIGLALSRYVFLRMVDEELFKRRVLVWGAGRRAASIGKRLRRRTDHLGFRIVAYVPAPGDEAVEAPAGHILPSSGGDLVRLALRHKVEELVVAMDDWRRGFPSAELLECRLRGIHVTDILSFLERESGRVNVELVNPSWLIFSDGFRCDFLCMASKRLFDVAVSVGILIVASPVALLTAIAIYLEDRGPILYRQIRTGQNGRLFTIFKFRSMRVDAEPDGKPIWASRNDSRATRVGAIIRRLRVDELPQVLNVLLGHMSFVGPRPERPAFVAQLAQAIPFYPQRHFVKPGITGWAQVRYSYGASDKDAQEKLEYDLYYVKHHSLAFDLMVLLQTVEIVLFRIGSR